MSGHKRLYKNYFADEPVYDTCHFGRRNSMGRELFLDILENVADTDPFFKQNVDATGTQGLI